MQGNYPPRHWLGSLMPLFCIFFFFGSAYGLLAGVTALIGNMLGKYKINIAKLYAYQAISLSLTMGITIIIIGSLLGENLLILLGVEESYIVYALSYFNWILFAFVPLLISLALNATLIAKGDSKSYRNTLILGFFLNLILNPLFVYGYGLIPAMGLEGIALSTILIYIVNMLYMFYKVSKTGFLQLFKFVYFIPIKKLLKDIFIQGWPSSLNMLVMSIGSFLSMFFISLYGKEAVAGFGIGLRVEQIMLLPALGINTAVLSIVSNNFGARAYDRVKETVLTALKYSYIISGLGIVILVTLGEFIAGIFSNDPLVIENAVIYIIIDAMTFLHTVPFLLVWLPYKASNA